MSANSSFNSSLLPLPESSTNVFLFLFSCYNSTAGFISTTTFTATTLLLLLPLCILVLYLGLQRWWQQRLSTGATAAASHSDVFTYHMMAFELGSISSSMLVSCGVLTDVLLMVTVGLYIFVFHLNGQVYFHVLTCMERYLAVVHPIAYRNLRKQRGVRIRNVSIAYVWLLSFGGIGVMFVRNVGVISITALCSVLFILILISFFSLSVLRILIRPGPGEGGGARQKLRAFYTMVAILSTLLLKFGGSMGAMSLMVFQQLDETYQCAGVVSMVWFGLPSSLVLPLLFLHKVGKLPCWKSGSSAGQ
ncbi:uncharacterized protein V6R79_023627 [Siganus canaliculatus]